MEAPLLLPVVSTAAGISSCISIVDDDSTVVELPLPPPAPSTASTRSIVLRVAAVLAIACASLFAQHEASKGFAIAVASSARDTTAAGRRFHLDFASNGRAERVLQYASSGVERALFPDASFPRKRVARVTVRMAGGGGHNLTAAATVDAVVAGGEEYVISLSPGLVMSSNKKAVAAAVRRAVARMWLWDGRGAAPARVTESMVEYLAASSGDDDEVVITSSQAQPGKQEEDDEGQQEQCMSAPFLRHLERRRSGFVARLNRAMRDRWSDAAVDAALGVPARPVCAAFLTTGDSTSDGSRGSSVAM